VLHDGDDVHVWVGGEPRQAAVDVGRALHFDRSDVPQAEISSHPARCARPCVCLGIRTALCACVVHSILRELCVCACVFVCLCNHVALLAISIICFVHHAACCTTSILLNRNLRLTHQDHTTVTALAHRPTTIRNRTCFNVHALAADTCTRSRARRTTRDIPLCAQWRSSFPTTPPLSSTERVRD
jgi:hypothetical protein